MTLGLGGAELAAFATTGLAPLLIAGVPTLATAPLALAASALAGRGSRGAAITMMASFLLTSAAVVGLFLPFLFVPLSIVPLLVVAMALPYLEARPLRRVMAGAALASIVVVLAGVYSPRGTAAVEEQLRPLVTVSSAAAIGLFFVLLWHYHARLIAAVAKLKAVHEDLARTHESLQGVERLKSQLLNAMAHELNTPLTPMLIHLHRLEGATARGAPARQAESLAVVRRNAQRLSRLVSNAVEVARLQGGPPQVHIGPVHVGHVVSEAVSSYLPLAEQHGIRLEWDVMDAHVAADRDKLAFVVDNLVSNAIKATSEGGRVEVRALRRPDGVRLVVSDDGVGLGREQLDKVFEPFGQVHDATRRAATGLGLGLFLSRGFVHALGGRLWAESSGAGKGASFMVELPLASPVRASPGGLT